ncbi:Bug family tripartite tricarboxylate transporter substrate binding protein [Falsirhodobacter halotolerans]|uniref:Bug family tripartite tricarboxylate transporter substrate binding protein n=1 Tax=Falsirhodobacter halotolerans TaxID=1146892 RepID=UPI001FD3F577|nr:tripartite tricarboxylate transporter substrate binding protein [Falsirhodobacter halotolerans]MCJ8141024.1 tripartite tricarboxylate transporter substrate binding protein [Falsirhodobacter halotolerans]
MSISRRQILGTALAAPLVARFGSGPAFAQAAYPVRRLTLVVPFDAGGSADRLARAIAQFLPAHLGGTPVTVVNRAGGSGALGHSWFIRQPDDGSTALVSPVNPYLISNVLRGQGGLNWDDFHHINGQWQDYYAVFVNNAQPYQTMQELLVDIRDNPGKVSCAIIPGDGGHISALILLDTMGIPRENVNWITYDGGGPMRTAVAGNQVTFSVTAALGSNVIADQVRALAVYRQEADPARWDAPAINEALAPMNVEVPVIAADLRCLSVHSSLRQSHPEIYEQLVTAYRAMLESDEFQAFAAKGEIGADWLGPEQTAQALQESYDIFAKYIPQM